MIVLHFRLSCHLGLFTGVRARTLLFVHFFFFCFLPFLRFFLQLPSVHVAMITLSFFNMLSAGVGVQVQGLWHILNHQPGGRLFHRILWAFLICQNGFNAAWFLPASVGVPIICGIVIYAVFSALRFSTHRLPCSIQSNFGCSLSVSNRYLLQSLLKNLVIMWSLAGSVSLCALDSCVAQACIISAM